MEDSLQLTRQLFIECNWIYDVSPEEHYNYVSMMLNLHKFADEMLKLGKKENSKVLELLARAAYIVLIASSSNEPFKIYDGSQKRSIQPDDFSEEELSFFETILNDVNVPLLKARLADLLWYLRKPRNVEHAKIAIDSYVDIDINQCTWVQGVENYWKRAARLSELIKDYGRLKKIKKKLFSIFLDEEKKNSCIMLPIAKLINELGIDEERKDLASLLTKKAYDLKKNNHFEAAASYFTFLSRIYDQSSDEESRTKSLVEVAKCFQLEADSRINNSNMIANYYYRIALESYRNVPRQHRDSYGVNEEIKSIREKITISGEASLSEMKIIRTPEIDISRIVNSSINLLANKNTLQKALFCFACLYNGPNYAEFVESAKQAIKKNPLAKMFGSTHMSTDGRVIEKTPQLNLSESEDDHAYKLVLHEQIQQLFQVEVHVVVMGKILPALRQLCMEHRLTKDFIISICHHSPIVSNDRENLLGNALWLGFEDRFDLAIHILCPQLEHVVRSELKRAGAHTSNTNQFGVENENGLGTLMELPEAKQVFGENLVFEIKSIFTESLGYNLRNQVAHGLLDDVTSHSIPTVYAWWMILRLVILSIINSERD